MNKELWRLLQEYVERKVQNEIAQHDFPESDNTIEKRNLFQAEQAILNWLNK